MFNRKLQVDLVKNKKSQNDGSENSDLDFKAKTAVVVDAVERGVKKIGFAVCVYVVLDTVRKVAVTVASK
ncbi:MAG: hypothetical protein ABWY25_03525 [Paenisporosarcina sp.]